MAISFKNIDPYFLETKSLQLLKGKGGHPCAAELIIFVVGAHSGLILT